MTTELTPWDEYFVHQVPEPIGAVDRPHPHWRESYFFDVHDPSGEGDVVFVTMARYPARERMDSLQMGRVGGVQLIGGHERAYDGDQHTTAMPGARIEVVEPLQELRIWADPADSEIGVDLTFRARTAAYGLRRGTMYAGDEIVWDQRHLLQSGVYTGTYTVDGRTTSVDGWVGQRDHSWGVRDHGRCPLWLWLQIQLDDGFLGVWHWELESGAHVYTDGCWAPADGSAPVPVTDLRHDLRWVDAGGAPAEYGLHGEAVAGLAGHCRFELADGRAVDVEAEGSFARPYEPYHRGGLSLMRVRTGDGRVGTAIYEVTGARHRRYFPQTEVPGPLPT
ncbi:MAG: hypothetical protein ACRDTP_12520 [Mycobacteriales bacterium]